MVHYIRQGSEGIWAALSPEERLSSVCLVSMLPLPGLFGCNLKAVEKYRESRTDVFVGQLAVESSHVPLSPLW